MRLHIFFCFLTQSSCNPSRALDFFFGLVWANYIFEANCSSSHFRFQYFHNGFSKGLCLEGTPFESIFYQYFDLNFT